MSNWQTSSSLPSFYVNTINLPPKTRTKRNKKTKPLKISNRKWMLMPEYISLNNISAPLVPKAIRWLSWRGEGAVLAWIWRLTTFRTVYRVDSVWSAWFDSWLPFVYGGDGIKCSSSRSQAQKRPRLCASSPRWRWRSDTDARFPIFTSWYAEQTKTVAAVNRKQGSRKSQVRISLF